MASTKKKSAKNKSNLKKKQKRVTETSAVVKEDIQEEVVDLEVVEEPSIIPTDEELETISAFEERDGEVSGGNEEDSLETEHKKHQKKDRYAIRAPRIITKDDEKKRVVESGKKETVVINRFDPSIKTGLSHGQVEQRIAEGLTNVTNNKNTKTYRSIILGNVFTFFNLLSFLVAGALIAVGSWKDCFFLLIVLCNMGIGIIQEIKAKKTIEKISLVSTPMAMVVRDKIETKINVSDVVLDDIIILQTGKQICADCIVVEGSIEVNESLLTGESVAVKKSKGDILYSGSFVVGGKCYAKVDKVGNDTYTSKLASQAKQYQKPKSELMGTLNIVIAMIGVIIVPIGILMFLNNYKLLDYDVVSTVEKTAGSIIGMIPAGMFLLTSMALAVGVIKLVKKRTLVQDLYSIEMLARTDVLCLDKTGTITDGTMKVSNVIQIKTDMKYTMENLIGSMLTALDDNNQTSRALITHFGYSKELTAETVLPFNSTRKMSGVTFTTGETFVFGAPEYVLKTKNAQVDNLIKTYASKGFRVLLFAQCDGAIKDDKLPQKREPIAIVVIEDHIREDAAETIAWFKENGVDIKIISGDNPITVSEVSRRVGVENAEKYISLEGLSQQQVIDAADKYTVFGRVSPEQKCILVKALKAKGHKVAMTGDGVNDILALKEADCSVAMASGSEATRLVSNLVLMDSNFSSMPSVVAEGRRVINNIQKSSSLFLMKTIYTMLLSVFCLLVKTDYPFTTKQVLLLEVLVIGIPSFFLALQPNNEKIKGKFLPNLLSKSLPGALILFLNVVACYIFDISVGTDGQYQTMASFAITFVGLVVLFRLCKPLDVFRGILMAAVITLCVLVLALSKGSYFEYVPLSTQNILFIICAVQLSYPVYDWIIKGLDKLIYFNKKE
ncbi:MAG: HAD-IC family P-type ATPase [Clostridia bacterium]|nr:HAD-IC family P-type ATPase [Clostridia bacterium]